MKNVKNLYVFSHNDFNEFMVKKGISPTDGSTRFDDAFISIIYTDGVRDAFPLNNKGHYFPDNAPNVLNISFDDVDTDVVLYEGVEYHGITKIQAKQIVNFIEENKGRNFYIHCSQGRSRSQGIARYILDMYGEKYGYDEDVSQRLENPCTTPNQRVVRMLKREFYKQYGYFE